MKSLMLLFLPLFIFMASSFKKEVPADYIPSDKNLNKATLLQLVNGVRASGCKCGDTYYHSAPPVKWNNQLEKAAWVHSEDMNRNHFFSHTATDGSRGGERIEREGYHWKAFGENIAMGYTSEMEVVKGWISSPGHCKNIMNPSYREMGVARSGKYWTQEFGTR